jgi:hypothetical protein
MTPEDYLLLTCTRQDFTDLHRQRVLHLCEQYAIRWNAVYQIAEQHGVAPLIYTNLRTCPLRELAVPHAVVAQFEALTLRTIVLKSAVAAKLREVLSFFKRREIDVMLIKGVALEISVYQHPWYVIHDVDLVIRAREEGFTKEERTSIHDLFAALPGFEYDFFEHHDVTMNGLLPIDFQTLWQEAVDVDYGGETALVMRPEDLLLAVCINACRKRFFRLKSLFDIAEIVNRHPTLDWGWLAARAHQFGCHSLVYTALLVTQQTLGSGISHELPGRLGVHPLRAAVIGSLVDYLSSTLSFSTTYPFAGPKLFGRHVTLSLLLTYASYTPQQVWKKMGQIYHYHYPRNLDPVLTRM